VEAGQRLPVFYISAPIFLTKNQATNVRLNRLERKATGCSADEKRDVAESIVRKMGAEKYGGLS
jgi:hypothetical protein